MKNNQGKITGIPKYIIHNTVNARRYLVMDYIPHTVHAYLSKVLTVKDRDVEIKRLILELFDIVKSFHEQGFIHRDIKESNLMIDEYGKLFVIDFGLVQERVKDGMPI